MKRWRLYLQRMKCGFTQEKVFSSTWEFPRRLIERGRFDASTE